MTTLANGPDRTGTDSVPLPVPWLLRRINQRYRSETAHRLAATGLGDLPQPGIWVLMAIERGVGEPNQLVRRMGVSKQAVSKLVENLAGAGFVRRAPNPSDRRKTALTLTAKGLRAVRVITAAVQTTEQDLATKLGADRFAQLTAMLGQLAREDS
jgi:DNA-binding MarR family transcriptional regulator